MELSYSLEMIVDNSGTIYGYVDRLRLRERATVLRVAGMIRLAWRIERMLCVADDVYNNLG